MMTTKSEPPSNGSTATAPESQWIDAAGLTNVGRVRAENEDAYLIATLRRSMVVHDASPEAAHGWFPGGSAGTLLVVADGMGGQGGGDIASRTAVNTVASYLLNVMPWAGPPAEVAANRASSPDVRGQLSWALVVGDSTVRTAGSRTATPHMGTTLTMAFVLWPVLYVAHVGDSRCYMLHAGKLSRLTTDHTVAQKVAESAAGPVAPTSQLNDVLWNSLGGSEQLAQPQIVKVGLELGDVLLLCSDGLTKHVDDGQIAAVISVDEPNTVRCARLVERANAAGGSDNVTVLIANARAASDPPATVTARLQH
jgi:protein phosphatase